MGRRGRCRRGGDRRLGAGGSGGGGRIFGRGGLGRRGLAFGFFYFEGRRGGEGVGCWCGGVLRMVSLFR